MPAYHELKLNFNSGEWSPMLVARTDLKKYQAACQLLENFIILPYGGVIRRPGTQYLGKAKQTGKPCRLIGFNFSVTTNFVLEFGDLYIRFWTNGIQVLDPPLYDFWLTGILYQVDDLVQEGTTNYRCLKNHTSTTFATDLAAAKWQVEESAVDPPKWVTKKDYAVNVRVKNAGSIYHCIVAHRSGVFATDAATKWRLLPREKGAPLWMTGVPYAVDKYISRPVTGGVQPTYKCLIAHTSGVFATDLAAGKWVAETPPPVPEGPHQLTTPYLAEDLREIQYCQINDVMYLVHPDYPVAKLIRRADDDWSYSEVAFKWPPLLEENSKNIKITPSGTTGSITLTATAGVFFPKHVGSTWQLGHNMAGVNETWTEIALGVTSGSSPAIRVRGPWSFTSYGTWKGELRIHRTVLSIGIDETIRTYFNSVEGQRNIATSGNEDADCTMYIQFLTGGTAGSSTPMARLEFSNAKVHGLVKITAYTSPTVVTGNVVWGMRETTATSYWSEGAFSKVQGFPRAVCLHEQRLVFGGTRKKPLGLHGSQIDDYENFQRGTLADQGYLFNLAANESNPINWMVPQQQLLLGTAGDEWSVGAQDEENAMGPGNIDAKKQSNFGSSHLQAKVVNEVVLFCQRQGKKMRELTYSFEKDGWVAPDLTLLAAHIAGTGFAETAFCQQPDAVFWCITNEGDLVGMTYERDQEVVGWHRHSTPLGTFESVATIYGGDNADEVWLSVNRTINGEEVRYIERFHTNFRPVFEAEDKERYWYLDCAIRGNFVAKEQILSGLDHLEGCEVGILGDGANQPTRIVTGGSITIQDPAKFVLVGLPYVSQVKPMNINIPSQDGTTQGRKVRIHEMVVRFYKSLTCQFSVNGLDWDEIFFRDRFDLMDTSPPVFTGDKHISTGAPHETQSAITLRQDRPFPCCVLATIIWANYFGD